MRTIGISMVRDEVDIIASTLRHMAGEVDLLIVADNGSRDGTRQVLEDLTAELSLVVRDDPDPAHYQSRKMTALAAEWADPGDWVVPFDADEIWSSPFGRISSVLAATDATVARALLYDHHRTGQDVDDPDPVRSMVWRRKAHNPLPKVAFRWAAGAIIHDGNHDVTLPGYRHDEDVLEVRHFPARSAAQWTRKGVQGGAALALTDLPEDTGKHWRDYAALAAAHGPDILADVYANHWSFPDPVAAGLVRDPAPYMQWRSDGNEA